jgi:hypothetical protein
LLIQGPVWVRHFPFFELASAGDFGAEVWRPGTDRVEAICGIFVASPLCLAGLAFPLVLRRFRDRVPPVPRLLLLTIYVSVFASLASVVLTVNGVTERYEMDFAPELLLLALFVLILFGAGRAATIVLAAGVAASALITACLSINGYENELIERNFAAFDSIARFVGDDDNTLRRVVYGIRLNGAIAFHQQPAGRREALVATGVPRRSNCVFVEYLDGGRIRLATYMSDLGTTYGPPIPVTANKAYVLTTEYRIETRHLTMKLDETAALDVATFFFPTSFADAAVLRNPNRMPPNIETFSGELNAPQGLQFAAAAAQ